MWVVEGNTRRVTKIIKNVARFDTIMNMILKKKVIRKIAKLSDEDLKKLDDMLKNQTKVSLARVNDNIDTSNTSRWEKVKN